MTCLKEMIAESWKLKRRIEKNKNILDREVEEKNSDEFERAMLVVEIEHMENYYRWLEKRIDYYLRKKFEV